MRCILVAVNQGIGNTVYEVKTSLTFKTALNGGPFISKEAFVTTRYCIDVYIRFISSKGLILVCIFQDFGNLQGLQVTQPITAVQGYRQPRM